MFLNLFTCHTNIFKITYFTCNTWFYVKFKWKNIHFESCQIHKFIKFMLYFASWFSRTFDTSSRMILHVRESFICSHLGGSHKLIFSSQTNFQFFPMRTKVLLPTGWRVFFVEKAAAYFMVTDKSLQVWTYPHLGKICNEHKK